MRRIDTYYIILGALTTWIHPAYLEQIQASHLDIEVPYLDHHSGWSTIVFCRLKENFPENSY
jgi:hypothetical protein